MDWSAVVVAIVAGLLGGGIVGLFTIRQQRRKLDAEGHKTSADAASVLTGAALLMVQTAQSEVDELKSEIAALKAEVAGLKDRLKELEKENRYLRYGTDRLTGQVLNLGATPVWKPRHAEPEPGKP